MIDGMPTVAVLMSTYNGEKYIRDQLDSIFSQENVSVKLIVRDDGSSDGTVGIVKEYVEKYPVELILDGENVRPGESFMRLVYQSAEMPDVDYYAFADQDDIWLPDKLRTAVDAIAEGEASIPTLYSSNQYIFVDGENRGLRHSEPQRTDLISHMTKNTIAGCTFVFNKALVRLVTETNRPDPRVIKSRLHDSWMMLVAIACGRVIYDEQSRMLYRIHSENVVGIKKISFVSRLKKLKRFFVKSEEANIRLITAKELLRLFPQMGDDKKQILKLYAEYQNSWKSKKALAFNKDIRENCTENPIVFTLKVLTNFV
ncbi:MAG: glycosyltransferase family 2 protein [Lachnospiraceae bacterium]|nr:glycosyltransferase family 2 protein [Lachnospiraceae bacterium]